MDDSILGIHNYLQVSYTLFLNFEFTKAPTNSTLQLYNSIFRTKDTHDFAMVHL